MPQITQRGYRINTSTALGLLCLFFLACSSSSEDIMKIKGVEAPPVSQQTAVAESGGKPTKGPLPAEVVVASVDGAVLTKGALDREHRERMKELGDKVPQEKRQELSAHLKRTLVDEFIVRSLLQNEVKRRGVTVTDQEIKAAVAKMEANLPQGTTFDEMIKRSGLTREKLHEEVAMGLKVNKLIAQQAKGKADPTDKEISDFYRMNKEKFKIPETVHVRHILVGVAKDDDDTVREQKRQKAEELRRRLAAGADFAQLAREYSDCPSKTNGGDLGAFTRGQMVKAFEEAAFAQKQNVVGPPVKTEYGYHVIEVLDHKPPRIQPLDTVTRGKIRTFLMQKKRYEAFQELMETLKRKADIKITADME